MSTSDELEAEVQLANTLTILYGVQGDISSQAAAIEKDVDKTKAILWRFVQYAEGKGKKPMGGDNNTHQQLRGVEDMIDIHTKLLEDRKNGCNS